MELKLNLSQKQMLKLVMTPRLQQALKLLQMPSLELSQHIEQELLANPLLEVDEETPEAPAEQEDAATDAKSPEETELSSGEEKLDWSEYFDDGFEYAEGGRSEREETEFHEKVPVGRTTLADSLLEQIRLLDLDEETLRIAEYLVGCLDEGGFLGVPLAEVAAELGVPEETALNALRRVQELDPPGIGARDLPECLAIQLRQSGRGDTLAMRIVSEHFEAFKQRQVQEIARALKVTPSDIQDATREIATLNPRPGAELAVEDARYVIPDLVVEKVEGQYVASLADGSVPRLRVSRQYREILERRARNGKENGAAESAREATSAEEVKFVQEKLKSASWLIQTIEQRRRTMIRVMEAIVEAQSDFFERGPQALRPLTLQDVAERIGMHESTVSRVTTNKYVQTPRGVFPLKYFFSSGLETESGENVSSKMAMGRIKELIAAENRRKPLSDQRIAELLRKEGLIVARRTVAKYRERMEILPARYRKEF